MFLDQDGWDEKQKRSKTVLISIRVPLRGMNKKKYSKKNQLSKKIKKVIVIVTIKKINKIAHSCNLLRTSFFKRYVKEGVVAAVFMFELFLFQIFG